jgi:hypothetical protein
MIAHKEAFCTYIKSLVIDECQNGSLRNYYEAQNCLNFCEAELAKCTEKTPVEHYIKTIALFYPTIAKRLHFNLPSVANQN